MTVRQVLDRIAGPLVLLVALAIALMYWQGRHQDAVNAGRDRAAAEHVAAVVDCQARFNAAVIETVKVREKLRTRRDLAAEAVFYQVGEIVRVAQSGRGSEELRAEYVRFQVVFKAYDIAIKQLHKYKKEHPLPEFPDCEARVARAERAAAGSTSAPSDTTAVAPSG